MTRIGRTALLALAGSLLISSGALAQTTLAKVKERGQLLCGTSTGIAGFSLADGQGNWSGLDVDVCRALAAAIFDDPNKVNFIPLASKDRLVALQSGEIDVLPRTTTWTLSRDAGQGLDFTAVNYYDGQGFQLRKKAGIKSVKELDGASICTVQGTTNELNLADHPAPGGDLEGADRPLCPPGRRPVVRHRALDRLRDDQCRGVRRDLRQCRGDAEIRQSGDPAPARRRHEARRRARADGRLGGQDRPPCRQLRRIL
ncbi:transporter substrate-binding domain-containing protein [Bosea rubneri]|uniref:transporter substrate-binding domain-containing protein n=1 Tax=Bosea rubneri TaxID=3075434 RepID=UPI0036F1C02C